MGAEENVRLWLAHLAGEFTNRNEEESLATMVEDATVCHVPTGSGVCSVMIFHDAPVSRCARKSVGVYRKSRCGVS